MGLIVKIVPIVPREYYEQSSLDVQPERETIKRNGSPEQTGEEVVVGG